jgi:hypothetical protein
MAESPNNSGIDTVYLRGGRRVAAMVFAVGWLFGAGGTLVLLAWMNLWVLVGLAGVVVVAVEVMAVRAVRIRLQFEPEGLVVANLFRTHRVRRSTVGTVEVGPWASPLGDFVTLFIDGGEPEPIRVEALSVHEGHEDLLDEWLDRIDDWRFRRR